VQALFQEDAEAGVGEVFLSDALARKYPNAAREWIWQYVFPSAKLATDPKRGKVRRHRLDESGPQRAITRTVREVGIPKRVTSHTLRHYPITGKPPALPGWQ
jgi:integrase